jgi:hypothetical protein
MQKTDYKTLETLILNITLNTHLNKKNLNSDMDLPSRVNPPKNEIKTSPPLFFNFLATVRTEVMTHTIPYLMKKKRVLCPTPYIQAQ